MKRRSWRVISVCAVAAAMVVIPGATGYRNIQASEVPAPTGGGKPSVIQPSSGADRMQKRNEVLERETAVSIKEQELKRIGQSLESRMKQMEEAKKAYEASLERKKAADTEKYQKMVKVYKGLKPAAAAALLDKMDEKLAMELLNRMDQKTVVKLIPLLNQERVLTWTRISLASDSDQGL